MRTLVRLLVLLAAPAAVAAQAPDRSLALETGLSRARGGAGLALALTAAGWLEGPVDWTATLGWASAPRTSGRAADGAGSPAWATAGLRGSAGERVRLSLGVELGAAAEVGRVGAALGASAGAGWRLGTVVAGLRAGARRGPAGWRTELLAGVEIGY
ncbi:MAG: hypothetical protein QM704_20225 [Anaeromyxobacteraceae bacterium]